MAGYTVCHVEVVCKFGVLRSYCVDAFYCGKYVQFLTACAYSKAVALHVVVRLDYEACNLEVGEAELFCFAQYIFGQLFYAVVL